MSEGPPALSRPVTALVIAHDVRSLPGMVGQRLRALGVELVQVVPDEGDPIPGVDAFDVVVSMGAPWCMRDPEVATWIDDELKLLRTAVERDVPVFGICFGAQALAAALGGDVFAGPRKEVGWMRIETLDPGRIDPGPWLQWHGDVFTLPAGAELLARTEVGPQAYALGHHLGVQFHPEADVDTIRSWVADSHDLLGGLGIDPAGFLAQTGREQERARPRTYALVDGFLRRAGLLAEQR